MSDGVGRRRVAAAALALAVVVGGFGGLLTAVPVRAQTVDANGATSFSVTAISVSVGFSPTTVQNVASGTTVTVMFTDADTSPHTFTIYGRQGVALSNPSSISPTELNKLVYGSGIPPLVNLNLTGTDTTTATLTVAAPGWYEFVCMEPGHFQAGMYGFIAFGEALPANLTVSAPSTGPGAAVFIIVGTVVSLVVIAIVLGFVVGRRRGSEFEMPPERLGYPEPTSPGPSTPATPTDGSALPSENPPPR